MAKIIIEIDRTFIDRLLSLKQSAPHDIELIESDRFEGAGDIVQALLVLGPVTITAASQIVIEAIRAKKHVSIKKDGMEITNLTERKALEILKKLSDED